jgi:hypothetical protein
MARQGMGLTSFKRRVVLNILNSPLATSSLGFAQILAKGAMLVQCSSASSTTVMRETLFARRPLSVVLTLERTHA